MIFRVYSSGFNAQALLLAGSPAIGKRTWNGLMRTPQGLDISDPRCADYTIPAYAEVSSLIVNIRGSLPELGVQRRDAGGRTADVSVERLRLELCAARD